MQVHILGLSQDLSLQTGESSSSLQLLLPDGSVIRAVVDDDTVQRVTALFVKQGGAAAERAITSVASVPVQAPAPRPIASDSMMLERSYSPVSLTEETEFGGDYAPEEAPVLAPAPAAQPQARRSPLRVEADEGGNPIIRGAGLIDPHSLVGGNTENEEDVGQA